jgi:two-component system, OmpR family, alkaline phosphatase synthesis response regulator PhoP
LAKPLSSCVQRVGVDSKVLIIEDDTTAAEIVRAYLARDGHEVMVAGDGHTGLRLAREHAPDLIVLDLMLPGLNGMEVCRAIRRESDVPIVMLTARVEEEDKLAGLDLGADDYVTKPFSPRELAARVRAILRRASRDALLKDSPPVLEYEGLRLDVGKRAVFVGDRRVHVTPTEFRLLVLLMRMPGRVFSRDDIIDQVFGDEFGGLDRAVDTHVSTLRRKLQDDTRHPKYIQTVYGMGYRLGHG